MKNPLLLLSLLLISCSSWAQTNEDPYRFYQSFTLKPLNLSNIELTEEEDLNILQAGVEYERLFPQSRRLSYVLPITMGVYYTGFMTDYERKGHQLYITPGVKYRFRDFDEIKGYAISAHLMAGYRSFMVNSQLVKDLKTNGKYFGLLLNNHYTFRIKENMGINVEVGVGARYSTDHNKGIRYQEFDYRQIDERISKFAPIMNLSLGLNWRW